MLDELPPTQSVTASKADNTARGTIQTARARASAHRNAVHQQQVSFSLNCCLMPKLDSPLATETVLQPCLVPCALQFHTFA